MFKILFLCTLVVLISAKPSPDDVPVAVSSVNEPKAAEAPQPVVKTSESESKNEEIVNEDQLKAVEDPDNIAARPLWLINRLRTTTTTAATTMAMGMSSAAGEMTSAAVEMTTAPGAEATEESTATT